MFRGIKKYLLLILLMVMFIPVTVFADDLNDSNPDSNLNDSNPDSNLNDSNPDSNLSDSQINHIREVIGQEVDIDILESQAYDYNLDGEDYSSVLDEAIIASVQQKLDADEVDFSLLGYTFDSDSVRYNGFDYDGFVRVYKDGTLVDTISVTVHYLNSDNHTVVEQEYVDEFVSTNDFTFEKEFYLEDYENETFDLDERLNDFSSDYGIECKSMIPPYAGVTQDFPYACFFDHKYYNSLVANLNEVIIVAVPSDAANKEEYALDQIKSYFKNYFEERGIENLITDDTQMFFDGTKVYAGNIELGNFVIEIQQATEPVVIIDPEPVVNTEPTNNYQPENQNYSRTYRRNYYTRTYYTDYEEDDSQTGSTLGEDEIVDVRGILDSKNTKESVKNKSTAKAQTSKKKTNKDDSKDKKESSDSEGVNVKKILLIVLSSITMLGVIVAIVNKLFIHSEI